MVSLAAAVAAIMGEIEPSPSLARAQRKKRYATYFPEKLAEALVSCPDDDASTWEFQPTSLPCSRPPSPGPRYKNGMSPAQQIALQYRGGDMVASDASSGTSSGAGTLVGADDVKGKDESDTSSIWEDALSSFAESEDIPTIRHSRSCAEALNEVYNEALEEMVSCGATADDALLCPRAGCRDTVRNLHALKMHLGIHNIADQVDGLYAQRASGSWDSTEYRIEDHLDTVTFSIQTDMA